MKKRTAHNRLELDDKYLVTEYEKGKTAQAIADELGVSKKAILRRLEESGVPRRKRSTYPEVTKEFLVENYVERKLSTRDIAKLVGCSNNLIRKRLDKFGINARLNAGDPSFSAEERQEKYGMKLEQHPRWKGGKTRLTTLVRNRVAHVSTEVLRESKYTCVDCGDPRGTKHVHHIKPFAEIVDKIITENPHLNINDDQQRFKLVEICSEDARLLDKENLVTLCEQCHKNRHTDSPVEVRNFEAVEAENREYIRTNHFDMSVKEMAKELNIRNYRIVEFILSEKLPFAYENPAWLRKRLAETHCTDISREFRTLRHEFKPADIRKQAELFGILEPKKAVA